MIEINCLHEVENYYSARVYKSCTILSCKFGQFVIMIVPNEPVVSL